MMAETDSPHTKKNNLSKRERLTVLGLSLHSWEHLMLVSLTIAALAAVAVVWTTRSVVLLTRSENENSRRELEEYKASAGEKTAALDAEAAKANERAAAANERTATAELKVEEIRKQLKFREFDRVKFSRRLENVPKRPVRVLHDATDPDSFELAAFGIGMQLTHDGWQDFGGENGGAITPKIASCAQFGGVTIAVRSVSAEEVEDFDRSPAERKSTAWSMADALDQAISNSKGIGVVTCPFLDDDALYILVARQRIFFPK